MNNLKRFTAAVIVMLVVLFTGRFYLERQAGYSGDNIINIYNWGDYIDPDLIVEFEEETGYRVIYETFDSNENMLVKVEQGGTNYDLVFPSEYTVEQMVERDLLQPLDHSRITGLENLDPNLMDRDFDPGNKYSLPYLWGTLGILYNTKYVSEEEVMEWKDLWDPKFKGEILLVDGAREIMGMGLAVNGNSLNEEDPKSLQEALQTLKPLSKNVRAIINDEIKMYMAQEEATVAVTFSGEAFSAISENEDLAYHVPTKGGNIWLDNVVIPKNAKNLDAAYAFISYLNRPDVAARNSDYIAYATPNVPARDLVDEEMTSVKDFYPSEEVMENLEEYRNLSRDSLVLYNDLYMEFKLEPRN